ncbi:MULTISPECIES: adenosylcobinamide-phosphate synthase CbiB [unclassified Roseitalea]|uniref:adenosylcobinamide-phosphate synthase CbiB n=1 Tax=unclassified Roseitalea TaxID=2639107 RepID=UPI00273FF641|nr:MULTISPECIES: adenosylcobinamide-phosphate synthase CbiB [unclassified Roseitalea]
MGETLIVLFVALLLDRFFGDPDWLWQRVPHPVEMAGRLIGKADAAYNRDDASPAKRERSGAVVIAGLLIGAVAVGAIVGDLLDAFGGLGLIVEIAVVTVLLAQKSLADHVLAVARALRAEGLQGGRRAVGRIVGRDPETLDEPGVCRAAIESLAENASDGVVAPAFWYVIFGLPGLFAYKMLNTADSMIGHRTDRHRAFGRATARLDDLINWVPARLTAVLTVLTAGPGGFSDNFAIVQRDAGLHRSPNAGWPESAMAVVTGLALGGPRVYGEDRTDEPFLNQGGRADATADDIDRAIDVFWRTMAVLVVIVGVLAVVFG